MTDFIVNDQCWITIPDGGQCLIKSNHFYKWVQLYQIHTYVMNEDKGHKGRVDGMLLYAKTDEDIVPDGMMRLDDGNRIFFRTLDLNVPFDKIKKQLENLLKA